MKKIEKVKSDRLEAIYNEAKLNRIVLNRDEYAKKLGYSRSHLFKMLQGEYEITNETIKRAEELLNITENVSREKNYLSKRNDLKNNSSAKRIPLYDAPAAAGITQTEMSPIHAPSGTIDVGDLLHDSQAAIRIYGNSMIPNYPPGCVVGLTKCQSKFIEPGEVYVIETRDRRMLKRIFYKNDEADSEFFTLYSDNTMVFEGGARNGKLAYPPFDLPKDEIVSIFTVTGVIKRNANSVIINRKQ